MPNKADKTTPPTPLQSYTMGITAVAATITVIIAAYAGATVLPDLNARVGVVEESIKRLESDTKERFNILEAKIDIFTKEVNSERVEIALLKGACA